MTKTIYAITTGGSTLDILGVFEDRALAQQAVDDWRAIMDIYDDGWDIQELTLWDRVPPHWIYHTVHQYFFPGGQNAPSWNAEPIFEWHPGSEHSSSNSRNPAHQETVVQVQVPPNGFYTAHISGSSANKADLEQAFAQTVADYIANHP